MSAAPEIASHFVTAFDGLGLHARDWRPRGGAHPVPVVCLPGLTRPAEDFSALALALAGGAAGAPRRVLALDYRGRGLSDRDPDPAHYDVLIENADIVATLTALGVGGAILVGTSRGGVHAMVLAALRPGLLRGVVLNDIGGRIEASGLARIRSYVGKLAPPRDYADAIDMLRTIAAGRFTGVGAEDWETYARLTFEEKDGRLLPRYDPALAKTLESFDVEAPPPELWAQFDALGPFPLMLIRGENSDLLSPETFMEMRRRRPDAATHVVAGQGHAPLLLDRPTIAAIAAFIETCGEASGAGAAGGGSMPRVGQFPAGRENFGLADPVLPVDAAGKGEI